MSDEFQENNCVKATMYVITEKGLEVGPFVYTKDTDSRVLCASNNQIHYSQGRELSDEDFQPRRKQNEKKKVKVVDLGADSLPADGISDEFLGKPFRDIRKSGITLGNFRTKSGHRDCKQKQPPAALKSDNSGDDDFNVDVLKRLLQSKKEFDELGKKVFTPRRELEMSLSGKRQMVLRRLRFKRQSEILLEEITKLRQKNATLVGERDSSEDGDNGGFKQGKTEEKSKHIRILKNIFYPHTRAKLEPEHNSSRVHLPSLKPTSIKREEKSTANQLQQNEHETKRDQNTLHSKKHNSIKKQQLVFLSPRYQYSPTKAESSAKMNINDCKSTASKKVRFPAVIDQRTGEMHNVPGVVTFRQSDYNQWSRRENIIRREVLPTRAPSLTYVSFLPSVGTKNSS